ncbi:hypothetical protein HDV04_003173 [Boothiomyces sp. JEL0838]|nr:hypothetical protein HDV04_003164 [Boothiomyces sp. JEL0838]KAJ3312423.1 hypothetical protein HDV04_003173 [Boothiomyces sp. JEL0838]
MKFLFGPWQISSSEIRRVVARFNQLTMDEVSDMFQSAQIIAKQLEKVHNADSMTITIQDGEAAGQSVPHVHIHLIPRHKGDWMNNDDIYQEIDLKEAELGTVISKDSEHKPLKKIVPDSLRVARTFEEMGKEAESLRPLFRQYEDIWK